MASQLGQAEQFHALHQRPGIFVMPNPWDAGSAKLFASLGFEAMATTSQGLANALDRVDGTLAVSRDEVIANCRVIAEATDLPVNADLENGYQTIRAKLRTSSRSLPQPAWSAARLKILRAMPPTRFTISIWRWNASPPLPKSLNVVMSAADPTLTVQQLEAAGVKRVSVGGALSRLGFAAVRDAALAIRAGSFAWVAQTMPGKDLKAIFQE